MQSTTEIKGRRRALGLSQQRLAQAADCSIQMLRLFESGYQPVSRSAVLDRIHLALDDHEAGVDQTDGVPQRDRYDEAA